MHLSYIAYIHRARAMHGWTIRKTWWHDIAYSTRDNGLRNRKAGRLLSSMSPWSHQTDHGDMLLSMLLSICCCRREWNHCIEWKLFHYGDTCWPTVGEQLTNCCSTVAQLLTDSRKTSENCWATHAQQLSNSRSACSPVNRPTCRRVNALMLSYGACSTTATCWPACWAECRRSRT